MARVVFRKLKLPEQFNILTIILSGCQPFCICVFSGAPSRAKARGIELHTHRIWLTSFRLVVTCLTERTCASTDYTGVVGETIKRKGGVSQACLGKPTSFILDIHNMGQNRIATDQYHMNISRAHVSTHLVEK